MTERLHFHALEKEMATYSTCLENPRDGGAWWAAVYGVTQSQTRLKRLSSSNSSSSRGLTGQSRVSSCQVKTLNTSQWMDGWIEG